MRLSAFFLILSLVFSTLTLTSCGDCSRKIDCSGFRDTLAIRWFPYTENQHLVFVNDSSYKTDGFTLDSLYMTGPYQSRARTGCNGFRDLASAEKDAGGFGRFKVQLMSWLDS